MRNHGRDKWSNGLAEWVEDGCAYLSVAFTWRLDDAYQRAIFYKSQGLKVRAGGPGTFPRKTYLADVAEYDVPFFMKQMAGKLPIPEHLKVKQYPSVNSEGKNNG